MALAFILPGTGIARLIEAADNPPAGAWPALAGQAAGAGRAGQAASTALFGVALLGFSAISDSDLRSALQAGISTPFPVGRGLAENVAPEAVPTSLSALHAAGVPVIPHGVSLSPGGAAPPPDCSAADARAFARYLVSPAGREHALSGVSRAARGILRRGLMRRARSSWLRGS